MTKFKKTVQYGEHTLTLETGQVARQATASVMASMGDTVILATVVGVNDAAAGQAFFPLTVNYQEKAYAAGKIPGGFFKREGRPSEKETLTSRLIDRPLRPLFPKGFINEVQIITSVLSLDPENDPAIPALIAASAVASLSGIPFDGPVAAAKVGYQDGNYILNPSRKQLENSALELVVAGTEKAVLMVESEAKELTEEVMLGAVMYGHEQMQVVIEIINQLKAEAGKPAWDWQPAAQNTALLQQVTEIAKSGIADAYTIADKLERKIKIDELREQTISQITGQDETVGAEDIKSAFSSLEKGIVRNNILSGKLRIDGRTTEDVRPITIETSVLPRTHGSALFTRGETQAIVVATLGTERDAQIIDSLEGESKDRFMLHYNFPPYCVGEAGFMSGPKRREIGHGNLAKRAVKAVLPSEEEFPYVLRVVSEITESNGSSSMASVCGASLSLMDAGVPLKAPVAGIAMGLVKDDESYSILTDILGDEDHLGDMDFKVAGTANGVTALQMDIKIDGITREIMEDALDQAKEGRLHILGKMNQVINQARANVSAYAPRILSLKINPDKIRDVIGKGGATIRTLTEETGANINITDDGVVQIAAVDEASANDALNRVKAITAEPEIGHIYEGKIAKLMDFGAFVTIMPGRDAFLHISEVSSGQRIENIHDVLSEGEVIKIKVLEIDKQNRVRVTRITEESDTTVSSPEASV